MHYDQPFSNNFNYLYNKKSSKLTLQNNEVPLKELALLKLTKFRLKGVELNLNFLTSYSTTPILIICHLFSN